MKSHRAFPPGRGNIKVPTASRRAAHAGLALYAPCRPKGRLARWFAWRAVDFLGPRGLPGRPTEWSPPMTEDVWVLLTSKWKASVGAFDAMAVHERIQASRRGFAALLLSGGNPIGFVKVRDGDDAPLRNEYLALTAISSSKPRSFEVPRPVAIAGVEDWNYLLTSAVQPDLHRMPVAPPLAEVVAEIQAGLESLNRPSGTPEHWQPMHGDFTPWNMRQRRDGRLFLVDWEDAGWAPPGADETYYRATTVVLGKRAASRQATMFEAAAFLRDRTAERLRDSSLTGDADRSFSEGLLAELEIRSR